jgi:predicted enzyme related to lactoylglutathione lyase
MPNAFVHTELSTDDVAAAKKFYRGLFAWKLKDTKMGPGMVYTLIDAGKGVGGGMMKKPMPDAPTQWLSYVEVASVAKTIAKAKKLGARICVESQSVMGMGTLGIFIDPAGAMLGLWEPAKKAPAKKKAKKR